MQLVQVYGIYRQHIMKYCQSNIGGTQLLLSTPNITYLSLPLSVYTPPDLKELPLQHLELSEVAPLQSKPGLLSSSRSCAAIPPWSPLTMSSWRYLEPMPGIQLESVKSLRHVKLRELLPTEALSLPRKCLLHLDLSFNWNWARSLGEVIARQLSSTL